MHKPPLQPDLDAARVRFEHVRPPIPTRDFDWSATFEGYEPGGPIGHGPTRYDALIDLLLSVDGDAPLMDWIA